MHQTEDEIIVKPMVVDAERMIATAPPSPDKSMTHRAIMLASMAAGTSRIANPLTGSDCLAMRRAFADCGVTFQDAINDAGEPQWIVTSKGLDHLQQPDHPLDLGNSGTAARLLIGLFSSLKDFKCSLTGDDSLRSRPMGRVVEPLRNMGAEISYTKSPGKLPLTITSRSLNPRTHTLAIASAQLKSALLFAGLSTRGETVVELPAGSRDHTETMLQHLGASIRRLVPGEREIVSVVGPWRPNPFECTIPADPSSVAFFAAMSAIHPSLQINAQRLIKNKSRIGFYEKLAEMGVEVCWSNEKADPECLGERVADLGVKSGAVLSLKPIHVPAAVTVRMIDEVPVLAIVATFADGVSLFEGLSELRVKESDRLSQLVHLLGAAGVRVENGADWLRVYGSGIRPVNAFSFESDDHRLVMSAMILATKADAPSKIKGVSWIDTSFPLFRRAFQNITSGTK